MILSIDPGYTTGVVLIGNLTATKAPILIDFDVITAFDLLWNDRIAGIRGILRTHQTSITTIVCERFKLFHHKDAIANQIGSEMPSARVIGTLEAEADRYGFAGRIEFQETWNRKQARVKPQHMDVIGASRHTFDAYCHAHYYARTHWRRWVTQ